MNHHPAHQGAVSSLIDNFVRHWPKIICNVQLFPKVFVLNKKMLPRVFIKYYSYALDLWEFFWNHYLSNLERFDISMLWTIFLGIVGPVPAMNRLYLVRGSRFLIKSHDKSETYPGDGAIVVNFVVVAVIVVGMVVDGTIVVVLHFKTSSAPYNSVQKSSWSSQQS